MPRHAVDGRRRERGAAAVEFAIILPVLLLCVLGLVEFGRAIWTQATLNYAVQAAARCYALGHAVVGATCETAAQTQQYATTRAPGLSLPASAFTVTNPNPACGVEVAASLAFDFLVSELLPYSQTLNATACFPI
jgi:Flp pilus assembly protein TadG